MKKGFTLVELLAVIMILGMITIIAVPSYLSINKSINKGLYEAKVADIMSLGSKYAETTGVLAFNVKDLINDGYINPDNETGEYYDNYNNRSMICDIVSISIDANGNYSSKIINHDGACLSKEEINNLYGLVKINIDYYDKNNNMITNPTKANGWVNAYKANLSYSLNTSLLEGLTINNISNVLWVGGGEEKSCNVDNINDCKNYVLSTDNTLSSEASISLDIDIGTNAVSEYEADFNKSTININAAVDINLDVEAPRIDEASIYVQAGETSSARKLSFEVSDGVGSGVSYYAFYNNSSFTGSPIYSNDNASNGVNEASFTTGGNYYLLVRDKVGNELKYDKPINVEEIDTTKPIIKLSNYDGSWTKNKVTINWSIEESSLSKIQSYYYTLGGGEPIRLDATKTSISFDEEMDKMFTIFAVDKAGNASNKASMAIRIDRTPPTATFTIRPTSPDGTNSWYKNSPTISYSYNDAKSGIDKVMRCSGSSVSSCGTESSNPSNSVILNSNANPQVVCIKAYDKVGNFKVYCSPSYKVDTVNPTVNSVTLSHTNGSLKVTATATEVHSGIAKVEMKLDGGSYINNGTSLTRTFTGVNMYANHTVYVRITDKAGRVSTVVSKTISTVTVKFDPNGGSGGVTKQVLPGTTYSNFMPGNPSRTHYTFNGWYNGSTKATTSMSVGTSSVTYKASWTIISYGININMLDPNGNEPYSTCGVGRMSVSYDGGNTWNNNVCNESRSTLPYGTVIKVKNISINSAYKLKSVSGSNEGGGVYSITVGDNAANNVINVYTISSEPTYNESKAIACDENKFRAIVNDTAKFQKQIGYQSFRDAMYDCAQVKGSKVRSILSGNKAAVDVLRNSSRTRLVSGYSPSGSQCNCTQNNNTGNNSRGCDSSACYFSNGSWTTGNLYNGRVLVLSVTSTTVLARNLDDDGYGYYEPNSNSQGEYWYEFSIQLFDKNKNYVAAGNGGDCNKGDSGLYNTSSRDWSASYCEKGARIMSFQDGLHIGLIREHIYDYENYYRYIYDRFSGNVYAKIFII